MEYVIIINKGGDSYVCNEYPFYDRYKLIEYNCGYNLSGMRKNSAKFLSIEEAKKAILMFNLQQYNPRIVEYSQAPLDLYNNGWPLEYLQG